MKKIALIAACILSTQAFANASSETHVDPVTYGKQNRYTDRCCGIQDESVTSLKVSLERDTRES